MRLNINTDAAVIFTNKLEKLHKSALPNAIRNSLNKAAFNVKQNTMPAKASRAFVNRSPNFFKANSRVEMAKGWDMKNMKATVGFLEQGLRGGNNFAVKDLEQQERGGVIRGKSFIPLNPARAGNSVSKMVRPMNRLSSINKIVDASKAKGKNDKQKFVKSIFHAGKGGLVLAQFGGREILWRVNSLNRTKSGQFKLTPIYSYKPSRTVSVQGTGFMRSASLESGEKIEQYYFEEARKQIERLGK
jgi:hypothetical protein